MHSCPTCGQACYCGGDIVDIEADPTAEDRCTCCVDEPDDDGSADFDPFDDSDPDHQDGFSIRTDEIPADLLG